MGVNLAALDIALAHMSVAQGLFLLGSSRIHLHELANGQAHGGIHAWGNSLAKFAMMFLADVLYGLGKSI